MLLRSHQPITEGQSKRTNTHHSLTRQCSLAERVFRFLAAHTQDPSYLGLALEGGLTSIKVIITRSMRVTLLCGALVLLLATLVATAPSAKDAEVIDGRKTTIALAVMHYLIGLIPNETVQDLLLTIIDALGKEDFDYWGEVKNQVMGLVGQYINAHNMAQVEVYNQDLTTLLDRYEKAPVWSINYPDKNQQAIALDVSIIAHRYLTEAPTFQYSLILHFQDISSIHIIVLKDAAETYSTEGHPPSRWWVDLDEQLDHYIAYGKGLRSGMKEWRLGMITCQKDYADGSCTAWEWMGIQCYDTITATDLVTGEVDRCTQVHGTHDCDSHCDLFRQHKEVEVEVFMSSKVTDVIDTWEQLKEISSVYAKNASKYNDPVHQR